MVGCRNGKEATRRLAELLPLGPLASSKISREDFKEFLFQEATPSFCVRDGADRLEHQALRGPVVVLGVLARTLTRLRSRTCRRDSDDG